MPVQVQVQSRRAFLETLALACGAFSLPPLLSSCAPHRSAPDDEDTGLRSPWGTAAGNPAVVMERTSFRSGADEVPAYLARPRRPGRFAPVIVIHANWLVEPYIPDTVAMLAGAGFAALAVDVFHFFPDVHSWEDARRVPGNVIGETLEREFREPRLVADIQAGIEFLHRQPFVAPGGTGLIGFCGGGWNALLAAAQLREVGAVVAFYAPVTESDAQHRAPVDLAQYIAAPVQYHQPGRDEYVPAAAVDALETALRRHATRFERFVYPSAQHGFFAFNRQSVFDPAAAALAWTRVVPFLRSALRGPAPSHELAPARTSLRQEHPDLRQGAALALHHH